MEHACKRTTLKILAIIFWNVKKSAGTWLIDEKKKIRLEKEEEMTPEGENYTILFVVTSSHVFVGHM